MNETLRRGQHIALTAGLAGLALCAVGAFANSGQFYVSWLFGSLFWLGLSLGCLATLMLHHLTGGRWGFPVRRFFEAGIALLPLMALVLIPIFFGLEHLYAWARPAAIPRGSRRYAANSGISFRVSRENSPRAGTRRRARAGARFRL